MPQDPSAWYDFTAADTLASALRKAADNVAGLAATRGSQLITKLGCWVGTGYERWKDDFNRQQSKLCDNADRLSTFAAQIDNASAQAREVKNGTPAQTTSPGPPAGAPRANSHPGRPGQQSAVPEDLYSYAKTTTDENDTVKAQVNGALLNAVNGYFQVPAGAYHPLTASVPDLYTGGSSPFITQLSGLLTTVRATDAHVHDVGKTFEDASTSQNSTWPPGSTDDSSRQPIFATVTLSDAKFNEMFATLGPRTAGTDLAKKFNSAGKRFRYPWDPIFPDDLVKELLKHVNDPTFMVAFFNNLDEDTFRLFLEQYRDDVFTDLSQPLDSNLDAMLSGFLLALSTGQLEPRILNQFIDWTANNNGSRLSINFYKALDKDPKLAFTFFSQIDDEHLNLLLQGYTGNWGSIKQPYSQDNNQKMIFDLLLKTAEQLDDPAAVADLLKRVSGAMDGVTSNNPQDVRQSIVNFVSYCMMRTITPSTSTDMDSLTTWGENYGADLGKTMQPFLTWMKGSDQKIADNQAMMEGIIENIALGIPMSFIPGKGVAYTIVSSAYASWLQTTIHPKIPYDKIPYIGSLFKTPNANADAVALAYVEEQTAEFEMVVKLIQSGQVVGPNGPVDLSSSQNILDVLNDPLKYHLNGQSVEDVLNGFRSRYRDQVINAVTQ